MPDRDPRACAATRYDSSGEIYFALASLLKHAPFLRHIWLVTDRQTPARLPDFEAEGICAPARIRIVDHRQIFEGHESRLPSFNSNAIEAMLCRIPGLSERFLSLNDDFVITRPVTEADFFDGPRPRLYARPQLQRSQPPKVKLRRLLRWLTFRPAVDVFKFDHAADLAARLCGETRYSLLPFHSPRAMRRSLLESFHRNHPRQLQRQITPRFRTPRQYLVPALTCQLALRQAGGILDTGEARHALLEGSAPDLPDRLEEVLNTPAKHFLCIQSLDQAPTASRRLVQARLTMLLRSHLPRSLAADAGEPERPWVGGWPDVRPGTVAAGPAG
ncbi:MAG: hypothetical protein GYB53_20750 [Rhodobacteraceae bacterium]|nr:hypothetical protein [Paracoccaceae bacterium]